MRTKITIYNNKVKSRQNQLHMSQSDNIPAQSGHRLQSYFSKKFNLIETQRSIPFWETFCDSFPEKFSKKFFSISENVRSFASRKSTPPSWK